MTLASAPAWAQGVETPASAQDRPADTAVAQAESTDTIVVTGSRIRRPNLEAATPVTILGAEEFTSTGQVSVGDVLNELPALRSTFSTSNSTRFIGTAGLSLLDLRGLGTNRTLVVVNGRRTVGGNIGAFDVDVNQIPTDLVERVDVVTGGSSAVYGSDAIAGVVNFVLKKDYEGIQLRGQGGVSSRGDAGSYFVSGLAGTNFGDGRGNVALALEYAKQNDYFDSQRPTTRTRGGFVVVDADPAGTPNGSDGIPDRIFVDDIRSVLISSGGTFAPTCGAALVGATRAARCRDIPGQNIARVFRFQPDGTIREADYGARDFRPLANNTAGGDGESLRGYNHLAPDIERITANLLAHYEVSEAFVPFFEGRYVRTDTFGSASGPNFFQPLTFSLNNPFLSAQARAAIAATLPAAATTFNLNRNNRDMGAREYDIGRDTFRFVAGARGDFNDDWSYEVSANYGQLNETFFSTNNRIEQRFAFATDAVRDPATGRIVCRVTIDPAARVAIDPALAPYLADDVAKCVPINLFGEGAPSQEALDYVTTDSKTKGKQTQFVMNGFVSGDSSQLFELPGGAVGFALGAEYRRETSYQKYDDLVEAGGTFLNAIPVFDPPSFEVKEAFAELRFPILADRPFFHELTLEAAGRVADYKGATGTVFAWNAGGVWAPIRDLRFRVNYSKAVRAPNLGELYSSPTQNFATVVDPCDVAQIGGGSPTRTANCAAAGLPAGFSNILASSLEITSGGNIDLQEETSESWTIGAVAQPRFVPGLSLTVDYYDIKVDDVITAPSAQQILNACYDAEDLSNQFCSLFRRTPAGTFVAGSLQQVNLNYAALTAKGIDAELAYRSEIGSLGTLGTRVIGTYVIQRNQYLFPDDPTRPDQILYELGDPRWAFNWSVDFKRGPLMLGYQMRYIGKQVVNLAEDVFSVGGRQPQNTDWAEDMWYSDAFYHDIRLGYDVNEKFNIYAGVDNVGDRLPEYGLTAIGAGSGIYDIRGRFFYVGAIAKF